MTVKIPKTSLNVFISYKCCPFELSVDQIFLKKVYTINLSSTIVLSTDDNKDKIFLKHKISISKLFLEDNVILKTG